MPRCSRLAPATIIFLCAALAGCAVTRQAPPQARPIVVAFLGDSLSFGPQLEPKAHYPALLERRFASVDLPVRVINAGIPGDTTEGGLARLDAVLERQPDVLVVALGVNDAPNDIPSSRTADNLRAIVARARARGATVVLMAAVVRAPWGEHSAGVVASVARDQDATLVDDLLAGVAGVPGLNLPDGIHPNAAGQRRLAENVWPVLLPVVVELSTGGTRRQKE